MAKIRDDLEPLTRALDVHSLRIIRAIDETGSISAAARALGYSQPAVTQHVQRLETRIGTPLLARSARTVRLTEAGALLARHAPRIEASLTALAAELAGTLGMRTGSVTIAAFPAAVPAIVAPLLAEVAVEYPGIEFELIEAEPERALEYVRDGRADIALSYRYATEHDTATVAAGDITRSSFLYAEDVVALVPRGRLSALEAPVDPAALADLPWIGGDSGCSEHVMASLPRGLRGRGIRYEVSTVEGAAALVERGLGVAFIPRLSLASIRLPFGVETIGVSRIRRRVHAVSLVEAAPIPAVAIALRTLSRLDAGPSAASGIRSLPPRARRHAAQFRTAAPLPATPPNQEEEVDMSSLSTTARASVAAAGVLLLAACATDPDTGPAENTGAEIDHITVAMPGSLSSLYVGQEAGILNYYIASIAQEGLVSLDAEGALQPGLAESWEQTDEVTYVYQIREDALFQDGTPVTADDVVFSLEQARDETNSPGLSYYLSGVESIEKTGESEVTVTLTVPDAAFAKNMSTGGAAFITSQAFWEAADGTIGTSSSLLLGSGPYEVTEFVPDSHVSLERVDTWWGELPAVKSITVEFIPDESTRLLAAQAGTIDVAFNVPLAQSTQWESLDTMRVDYVNDLSYVGMYFNTALAPFDDPKVREAFAHSVDRAAIVERVLRGHGEVATAIATPESLASVHGSDEARALLGDVPQYAFDLDAAAAALAESGHPGGFETDILYPSTGPQLGTAVQSLAENLAQIGVKLNVREVPIEEWLASLDPGSDYGVGLMWYFSTLGDPAEVPSYLLGAGNLSNYENPAVLELLGAIGAETDEAARIDLILEVERLQADDVVNVPLWWGQSATAFSNTLGMDGYSSFAFISAWPTQLYRTAD